MHFSSLEVLKSKLEKYLPDMAWVYCVALGREMRKERSTGLLSSLPAWDGRITNSL